MNYQRLTDSEDLAFRAVFPHESKWADFVPVELNSSSYNVGHVADQHRAKKRLVAELRAMTEAAETDGKRALTDSEKRAFEATSKIIENLDYSIHTHDSNEQSRSNRFRDSDFNISQSEKVIFRSTENITDHRPIQQQTRALNVGRIMKLMALGGGTEAERRALNEGTDNAGGYTVPAVLMPGLIDLMRKKSVCNAAGMSTVLLQSNKTSIAKLLTDPQAGWRLELGNVAESEPTFEKVEFIAKSLAVMVKISRELLADSLNIEQALMDALTQSLSLEVDRVCLFGTGTNPEPRGIANTSGILTHSLGTNGGQLTNYAAIITALQKLSEANAEVPTALIMAPRTKFGLAGLTDTTGQPLNAPSVVASIPQLDSTSIPVNMVKGTATNATKLITGDFTQLLLGVRESLQIELLKERFAETMELAFLASLRVDVAVAHAESFCVVDGIIP